MSMSKGPLEKRERLLRLCKRIAAGDGGTKAELQSAVLKYAATQYVDTTQALKNLYHDQSEIGHLVRKAVEVIADHDDGDHDAGDRGDGGVVPAITRSPVWPISLLNPGNFHRARRHWIGS
jgi:hypothetical protein